MSVLTQFAQYTSDFEQYSYDTTNTTTGADFALGLGFILFALFFVVFVYVFLAFV